MSRDCGSEAAQRLNSAVGQACNVVDASVCARIDQQWQYRIYCKSLKSSERQLLHRYLERSTLTQIQSNTGEYNSQCLIQANTGEYSPSEVTKTLRRYTVKQVNTVRHS